MRTCDCRLSFYIFAVLTAILLINLSSCQQQIWTTGNPYELGVGVLSNFFNYSFSPMMIDHKLLPAENYTHISVGGQKVVLTTSNGRILMFGSNQNFPSSNPAAILDVAQESSNMKITINEPIEKVISMSSYIVAIGKTKIQYFFQKQSKILSIPDGCVEKVFLPEKGGDGYVYVAENNGLCAIFSNGVSSLIPVAPIQETFVINKIDTSLWLPKGSNIMQVAARKGSFLVLTDKFEIFTWGVESLSGNAFIDEWSSIMGTPLDPTSVEAIFPTFAKGFKGKLPIDIMGGVEGVIVRFLGSPRNKNYLYSYFTQVAEIPEDDNAIQMSVGDTHAVILKRDPDTQKNFVYSAGSDDFGELGTGTRQSIDFKTPQKMKIDFKSSNPTFIAADCHFSIVATELAPRLFCNGRDSNDLKICSGHGKCTQNSKCMCFAGFYGNDCEKMHTCFEKSNLNADTVCSGNGMCVDMNKCECYPGYIGDQCQNFTCLGIAEVDPKACSGHGQCKQPDTCVCDPDYIGAECQTKNGEMADEVYYYEEVRNPTTGAVEEKLRTTNAGKYFLKGESIQKVVGSDKHLHILTNKNRLFFWGQDIDFNSGFGIRNFATKTAFEVPFFKRLRKLRNEVVHDLSKGARFTSISTQNQVYITGMFPDYPNDGFKFPNPLNLNCTNCHTVSDKTMNYIYSKEGLRAVGDFAKARIGEYTIDLTTLPSKTRFDLPVTTGTQFLSGCAVVGSFIGVSETGMLIGQLGTDIRITKPTHYTHIAHFWTTTVPNMIKYFPIFLSSIFKMSTTLQESTLYKSITNIYFDFVLQLVDSKVADPIIGDIVNLECADNFGAFERADGTWYGFGYNYEKALPTIHVEPVFCFYSTFSPPLNRFGEANLIQRPSFGDFHAVHLFRDGRVVATGNHNFSNAVFPGQKTNPTLGGVCNSEKCEIPIRENIREDFPQRNSVIQSVLATNTKSFFVTTSAPLPRTCDGAPEGSTVGCSGRGICNNGKCSCPALSDLDDVFPAYQDLPSFFQNDRCQVNEKSSLIVIISGSFFAVTIPIVLLCCLCCCAAIICVLAIPICLGTGLAGLGGCGISCTFCCRKRIIKKFQDKQTFELTQALLRTKTFDEIAAEDAESNQGTDFDSAFSVDKSLFSINYDDLKDLKELDEQGGSGCLVFRASWKGEIVFVKLFKVTGDAGKYDLSEFKREVQLMASMNHSSIVSFFGMFFAPPKRVGYVTEFCTHGNLYSIIGMKVPMKKKLTYLVQIAKGMRYLHEKGVIFRDLKCQNVLLDENYNVKLTDFGISRLAKSGKQSGTYTKSVGTSQYMAPEIVRGEKYNEKVDVYSYSILMYEVYYDTKKPFGEDTPFNVEFKVAQEKTFRPKLQDVPPENGCEKVHTAINSLMQLCWDDDPETRPSFGEVIEKLSVIFVDFSC